MGNQMKGFVRLRTRRIEKLYLPTTIAAGVLVVLFSVWQLATDPVDERWFILVGLTILSGTATLRIPGTPVNFSISDSFTMAAALLFGPAAGTVTVAVDGLVISVGLARRGLPPRKTLYNATAPPLAMWIAAQVFFLLVGTESMAQVQISAERLIVPLTVFAALFFFLNTGLIAVAIAFERGVAVVTMWRQHFLGLWLTYFGGAAVAGLLIVLVQGRNPDLLVLMLLAPIPLIIYATFRNAVGRMQDRVGHLDQVNQMYLCTIEALAQAIDAKDQVTHGHLRRVQQYAVTLARAIGVNEEPQLRALEAASLLHDIGKLAVPEHILNKPSTLTPAEFDKMKEHASIGADILSQIGFPYPVVPIVRHHHERWDGKGYPAGLAAEEIPIGARILSVVDCFDALTSDRPYRSKLTHEEAIKLVQSRSGTMYDPHVVQTFVEVLESAPVMPRSVVPSAVLSNITRNALTEPGRSSGGAYDAEALGVLFDLGAAASAGAGPGDALWRLQAVLQRVMPADIVAVYVYNAEADCLVAAHVTHAAAITGTTINRGQRLTGWVAANRRTINSDAALDLGNLAMKLDPTPQACLSTDISADGELLGVLTLYSTRGQPFTDAHIPIVEVTARGLAGLLGARPAVATTQDTSATAPAAATPSQRIH
jgi:putative nucleotidyltransferase with HDIG domain